jgi:hypothetical protein
MSHWQKYFKIMHWFHCCYNSYFESVSVLLRNRKKQYSSSFLLTLWLYTNTNLPNLPILSKMYPLHRK